MIFALGFVDGEGGGAFDSADLFYGVDGHPGLRDVVSVYCKLDKINVNSITSPVLQALGVEAADADA